MRHVVCYIPSVPTFRKEIVKVRFTRTRSMKSSNTKLKGNVSKVVKIMKQI